VMHAARCYGRRPIRYLNEDAFMWVPQAQRPVLCAITSTAQSTQYRKMTPETPETASMLSYLGVRRWGQEHLATGEAIRPLLVEPYC
jgi:hypothetical protein